MKGSDFVQQIKTLPRIPDRENAVEQAVKDGHFVSWPYVEIEIDVGDSVLVVRAAADYLAIGEPADFVRVPLSPLSAQRICDMLDAMLPTTRLVDLLWKNADVRLKPQPWGPPYDASMLSVDRFAAHDKRVETQRAGRTGLVAGHKKDVVLSQRLVAQPGRVAIYGWHQLSGTPIQPLSLVHENTYADYSHGIRLVSRTAYLDGSPVSLETALQSGNLASHLSAEGPLGVVRVPGVPRPAAPEDFAKPLGARALSIAQAELSKPGWESPPGSLSGPRIKQYFAGCQRKGKPLGLASGNWCAAFASFCEARAAHDGEDLPHGYRAAVAELWADALQSGAARTKASGYKPRAGDLALYARAGESPLTGGKGHVGRVVRELDAASTYETIEGNHLGTVARVTRTLEETVGFVAYPDDASTIGVPTDEDLETGSGILSDPPTDETPDPPAGPQRLPADKIPVSEADLYAALGRAWKKRFGTTPARASLLVLLAHWALETGRGKAMHAYNIGNIKSRQGDGRDYTFYACNELLNGKWVWFYPDEAGCRFRAYKTLDLGVEDYLSTIRDRFDKSWSAVIAGSPGNFCHLLRVQRYYTAPEGTYTAAVVSLFNEYSRTIAVGPTAPNLSTVAGVQSALATLGFDPGPANGQPGARYVSAVKAFQASRGLEADGIVGPLTRAGLAAALADKASAPDALVAPHNVGPGGSRDIRPPGQVAPPEPTTQASRFLRAIEDSRGHATDFSGARAVLRRFGIRVDEPEIERVAVTERSAPSVPNRRAPSTDRLTPTPAFQPRPAPATVPFRPRADTPVRPRADTPARPPAAAPPPSAAKSLFARRTPAPVA